MRIVMIVNGERRQLDVEPCRTLADALREELNLTGMHLGCEHGVCCSCTVLGGDEAVRLCLMFAVQCDGEEVRTVEGLGGKHPLQEVISAEHGLQCGFCTPGFLMLTSGALEKEPDLADDPERLLEIFTSTLCRCTGYEGIRRAILGAADEMRKGQGRD